jgi:hypothetical protein
MADLLGDPNFQSTSHLKAYCEHGRQFLRPVANELRIASEELKAALKEIPGDRIGNVDSKVRARIVSAHLLHAAEGVEMTCAGLVRCFLSFEKHFLHNSPARSKKVFKLYE